jgi:hypothetical protein
MPISTPGGAELSRARQRGNQGDTGLVSALRAELERGPASVAQIAQRTGFGEVKVRTMLNQLCTRQGGVQLLPRAGNGPLRLYAKYVPPPRIERYMPVFKPLEYRADRDPLVRQALCEGINR